MVSRDEDRLGERVRCLFLLVRNLKGDGKMLILAHTIEANADIDYGIDWK